MSTMASQITSVSGDRWIPLKRVMFPFDDVIMWQWVPSFCHKINIARYVMWTFMDFFPGNYRRKSVYTLVLTAWVSGVLGPSCACMYLVLLCLYSTDSRNTVSCNCFDVKGGQQHHIEIYFVPISKTKQRLGTSGCCNSLQSNADRIIHASVTIIIRLGSLYLYNSHKNEYRWLN